MTSGAGRLAVRAVLLGAVALSSTSAADAASRLCRQLQAELAGSGGQASPARLGKYDSAIARQGREIAKARSRAQRAGCGFSIFGGDIAACATLNSTIERMNANLDSLRNKRSRLAKGGTRGDRARLFAALEKHGCTDAKPARKPTAVEKTVPATPENREILDGAPLSGNAGTEVIENNYLASLIDLSLDQGPQPQGEFRTLCVRTCDGYFYPMSNAATLRDFERDQKNCEVSCPGTQMQVFYMRGIGGDPAEMTSAASGKPYRELPTAFLYKKPTPAGAAACGCNAPSGYQVIGDGAAASASRESPSIMSFGSPPASRPAQSRPTGGEAAGTLPAPAQPLPADRKVRVVAPAFLPAPEAATGLRAPAPTPNR
ncbi:MAG: DUF2865 domain-containing protein [Mesorhizobium sp.]